MGDSGGGGLALSLLLRLRDEGIPLPAAAVALSPWTDLALTGPSLSLNASADPLVSAEQARRFVDYYLAAPIRVHRTPHPFTANPRVCRQPFVTKAMRPLHPLPDPHR
jgi:epsilon-lactone hydrolase